MSRKTVSALIVLAIFQSLAMSTWAGELVVHDAVVVTDGSTRLVNCQNTRGFCAQPSVGACRRICRERRCAEFLAQ